LLSKLARPISPNNTWGIFDRFCPPMTGFVHFCPVGFAGALGIFGVCSGFLRKNGPFSEQRWEKSRTSPEENTAKTFYKFPFRQTEMKKPSEKMLKFFLAE